MATISVTVPTVTEYTVTPSRTSPTTFFADRETRLNEEATRIPEQNTQATALNTFKTQANAVRDEINDLLTTTQTSAGEAATSATNAGISALQASGSANFKGDWITLTAYTVGQSVYYSGNFYVCKTANSDATFTSSKWVINVPLGAVGNINNTLSEFSFKSSTAIDKGVGSTSYTRASKATYIDRYGKLKYLANDVAGFNRDGIIIEPASTNLLTHTENFENSAWNKVVGVSVLSDTATAPDGTTTADTFIPDIIGSYIQQVKTPTANLHTMSIYVKSNGTLDVFTLLFPTSWFSENTYPFANFTISTESLVIAGDNGLNLSNATVEVLSNNWYRISVTIDVELSAAGAIQLRYNNADANGTSDGFYIWGAQLEQLPDATTYIPSTETFTSRASTATYYDATGTLQTAAIDTERLTYNPSDLTAPASQLFEEARTNLFTQDILLSDGDSCTRSESTISSVDDTKFNTYTASVDDPTESYKDALAIGDGMLTNGSLYTFSVVINPSEITSIIRLRYGYGSIASVSFTPTTKTFIVDSGSPFNYGYQDLKNGLIIVWMSAVYSTHASGLLGRVQFNEHSIGDTISFNMGQIEKGSYPTSYIPTVASPVTRNADVYTSASSTRVAPLLTASAENIPNLNEDWTLSFDLKVNGENSDTSIAQFLSVQDKDNSGIAIAAARYYSATQKFQFFITDLVSTKEVTTSTDSFLIGTSHRLNITFNKSTSTLSIYQDNVLLGSRNDLLEIETEYSLFKLNGWATNTVTVSTGNLQLSNIVWQDICLDSTAIALN